MSFSSTQQLQAKPQSLHQNREVYLFFFPSYIGWYVLDFRNHFYWLVAFTATVSKEKKSDEWKLEQFYNFNSQHVKCFYTNVCLNALRTCLCLHLISDNIIFNLTSYNDSLQCEVSVSRKPGFVLSIFHNGCKMQTLKSGQRDAVTNLPYVTLSESVSLRAGGTYECQLHLNGDVVTKSVFHYHLAGNNFPHVLKIRNKFCAIVSMHS